MFSMHAVIFENPSPCVLKGTPMRRLILVAAVSAFSIVARGQSTPGASNSGQAIPTTRPHTGAPARPMTPMERIAELERRVAELERIVAQLSGATPPGDASTTQP